MPACAVCVASSDRLVPSCWRISSSFGSGLSHSSRRVVSWAKRFSRAGAGGAVFRRHSDRALRGGREGGSDRRRMRAVEADLKAPRVPSTALEPDSGGWLLTCALRDPAGSSRGETESLLVPRGGRVIGDNRDVSPAHVSGRSVLCPACPSRPAKNVPWAVTGR
jgi:hypothetical protein